MKTIDEKLELIGKRFSKISYNRGNYYIGGGLASGKFESKRHQEARNDGGKSTLGEVVQLFKKATELETPYIKEVITHNFPNLEWHHAGKLPKNYGGGMKKTYFMNSDEISKLATNWHEFLGNYDKFSIEKKKRLKIESEKIKLKNKFLKENATYKEKLLERPKFFHELAVYQKGKYGWFDCSEKSYNLPKYYSGYQFHSEELFNEFLNM